MPENKNHPPEDNGPRAFSVFLQKVGGGDCHVQLSDELHKLAKLLQAQSKSRAAKLTGSLTLTLKLTCEDEILDVAYAIKKTEPMPHRPRSTFWIAKDGNVIDENPKQKKLEFRDVSASKEAPKEAMSGSGPTRSA